MNLHHKHLPLVSLGRGGRGGREGREEREEREGGRREGGELGEWRVCEEISLHTLRVCTSVPEAAW